MSVLTRSTIRSSIASQVGDSRPLVATSVGSLNTFTDARNLTEEDNGYAGCDLIFTGPTAALMGKTAYVASSDFSSSTLTFRPNVPVIPPIGETAELFNYRNMVCTIQEYNQYINDAILYAQMMAEVRLDIPLGTFAQADVWTWTDAPYVESMAIPDAFRMLSFIYYVDSNGVTYYPERGSPNQRDGWYIDGASRRVVLDGCTLPSQMDGSVVHAVGYGPPQTLNADSDFIDIDPQWLFAKVKAMVYGRMVEKGLADKRSDAALNEGLAQNAERGLRPGHYPPNTTRIT